MQNIQREIIIDLFAGGGGASEGIEQALRTYVTEAINHDPDAIKMHKANHPNTHHWCESVWKAKPLKVTQGRPVGLLWASPDCTHHSRAKGGKPVTNKKRGLAWAVTTWARLVHPRIIILENVQEFKEWGPLTKENKPDKLKKGMTFRLWANKLRGLGYKVEWKVLCAADYGAPTIRKRLFLIARCDGQPICWPEPTHGPGGELFKLKPYRTAAECIDWTIPCPSIFDRKKPLAKNTRIRIAKGLRKFVIEADEPMSTVMSKEHDGIVMANLLAIDHKKGNGAYVYPATEPVRTITTENRFAAVATYLTKFYKTNIGSDMRHPVPTVTATGQHIGEVRAFLIKYYGTAVGQSVKKPLHTVTTKERLGLVTIQGQEYQIADIGLRMLTPRELALAQGFPASYILTGKSKSSQVAKIGNSVCPPIAEAIVRVNVKLLDVKMKATG